MESLCDPAFSDNGKETGLELNVPEMHYSGLYHFGPRSYRGGGTPLFVTMSVVDVVVLSWGYVENVEKWRGELELTP